MSLFGTGISTVAQSLLHLRLAYLHSAGVTTSHSPRDTPQMNSVTKSWVRSVKEKVMSMTRS